MVLATGALHLGWVCACSELTCAFAIGVRSQGSFDADISGVSPSTARPSQGCLSVKHHARPAPSSTSATKDRSFSALYIRTKLRSCGLFSFTTPLTVKCISRRPNCTGTFQCRSNNEHVIPRDRSLGESGRGSRSSGCLAAVVVLLFALLGRWVVRRSTRRR